MPTPSLTHCTLTSPSTGVCAACNKPILTKVVNALGCQWHKEHFTCAQCDVELGSSTYYESNGRPYCEKDYHELFAPRCAYCNGPILEVGIPPLANDIIANDIIVLVCAR